MQKSPWLSLNQSRFEVRARNAILLQGPQNDQGHWRRYFYSRSVHDELFIIMITRTFLWCLLLEWLQIQRPIFERMYGILAGSHFVEQAIEVCISIRWSDSICKQLTASMPNTSWNKDNRMKKIFSFFNLRRPSATSFSELSTPLFTDVTGSSWIIPSLLSSLYTLTCEETITASNIVQISTVNRTKTVNAFVYLVSHIRLVYLTRVSDIYEWFYSSIYC